MKKLIGFLLVAGIAVAAYGYFSLYGGSTGFAGKTKFLYIPSKTTITREDLLNRLKKDSITRRPGFFDWAAKQKGYYQDIRPGKYRIAKDMSVMEILNMLKAGKQTEVPLVIGKMRTKQQLARRIANYIESDSAAVMYFLENADSLKSMNAGNDSWMSGIIQNTYNIYWTQQPGEILRRLEREKNDFWKKNDRLQKAEALGLTPHQVYTLASIVEEESNNEAEKPTIASVYLNRLRINMPLQADPTVRFAKKDFVSNIVTYNDLRTPGAYNTYLNRGLPPGPICIPQISSIDAVLNAAKTDYLYFVAHPELNGTHKFNSTYSAHQKDAKIYQDSLRAWMARKAEREKASRAAEKTEEPDGK